MYRNMKVRTFTICVSLKKRGVSRGQQCYEKTVPFIMQHIAFFMDGQEPLEWALDESFFSWMNEPLFEIIADQI